MPMSPSFGDEHVHVVGARPDEGDLAAGDAQRGEEGRRLDAIGDHGVLGRVQLLDTLDLHGRAAGAQHLGAHAVQEGGQIGDLGLAGRVVDDRRALGQHGGHQRVLGGARRSGTRAGCGRRGADRARPRCSRGRTRSVAPSCSSPRRCMSIGRGPKSSPRRAAPPAPGRSEPAAVRGRRSTPACARPARRAPPGSRSGDAPRGGRAGAVRSTVMPIRASTSPIHVTSRMSGTLCNRYSPWRQRGGGQELEHGVLRSAHLDGAFEGTRRRDPQPLHAAERRSSGGSPYAPAVCPRSTATRRVSDAELEIALRPRDDLVVESEVGPGQFDLERRALRPLAPNGRGAGGRRRIGPAHDRRAGRLPPRHPGVARPVQSAGTPLDHPRTTTELRPPTLVVDARPPRRRSRRGV